MNNILEHIPAKPLRVEGCELSIDDESHRFICSLIDSEFSGERLTGLLHMLAAAPVMLRMHQEILTLAEGWDDEGAIGPRKPLSWEMIARMALDYACHAMAATEIR